jgi:multidrug efflux pump subunit AcrB
MSLLIVETNTVALIVVLFPLVFISSLTGTLFRVLPAKAGTTTRWPL